MIVLPARNEGPRVGHVLREIRDVMPGVPVVVVENGSTDDTAVRAAEAGATVLHSGIGYARALRRGFIHALRQRAPWVVQMDADGQHPAFAIPALLEALTTADLVVGSRFAGVEGYQIPLARRGAIRALGMWASVWAGQRLRDVTSGLRAWRPDAIAAIVADYPEDIADANVLVRAVRMGFTVTEVPVAMRDRAGGLSQHRGPATALFAARMALLTAREAVRPIPAGGPYAGRRTSMK